MFQWILERVTKEPTALAPSSMILKWFLQQSVVISKTSPKSGFLRACEQIVDFPVPQDVSKISKCQVSSSNVLAVFTTGDVKCFGSIHDEDQADVVKGE